MGTPVLVDPFHSNRWEYVYSFQEAGGIREQRHITLHFENEKLSHVTGDIEISNVPKQRDQIITEGETIIFPESNEGKKGFFGRLLDKLNPLDDE